MAQPCIICGRKIARKIKCPSGSLHLCTDRECLQALNYRVNDGAVPVTWFCMQEIKDRELINETIFNFYSKDESVTSDLADDVSDYIWSGEIFGEMFHEAVVETAQKLEKN